MNIQDITKQIRAFADELDAAKAPEQPSPFTLPTPPPGMQWHRTDGWTAEMLPLGTRPLVVGEKRQSEDEWVSPDRQPPWKKCRVYANAKAHSMEYYRTTRPLLFQHNGHEWTWHRVGDPMPCEPGKDIEFMQRDGLVGSGNSSKRGYWGDSCHPDVQIIGWRYADAEKPAPKQPLGPEDVPPGTVLRGAGEIGSEGWCLITSCSKAGVRIWRHSEESGQEITWERLRAFGSQINRSIPLTGKWNPEAWEACEK